MFEISFAPPEIHHYLSVPGGAGQRARNVILSQLGRKLDPRVLQFMRSSFVAQLASTPQLVRKRCRDGYSSSSNGSSPGLRMISASPKIGHHPSVHGANQRALIVSQPQPRNRPPGMLQFVSPRLDTQLAPSLQLVGGQYRDDMQAHQPIPVQVSTQTQPLPKSAITALSPPPPINGP